MKATHLFFSYKREWLEFTGNKGSYNVLTKEVHGENLKKKKKRGAKRQKKVVKVKNIESEVLD